MSIQIGICRGGVGLTGVVSEILQRHCCNQESSQTLVWMVRTIDEMNFFVHQILGRLDKTHRTTRVKIFVTATTPHQEESPLLMIQEENQVFHAVTYKSISTVSFENVMTKIASMLGIAFSFLAARLLCCYQPVTGDDNTNALLHECSLAFQPTTTCLYCSSPISDQQLPSFIPCCTVEICFLSFRVVKS